MSENLKFLFQIGGITSTLLLLSLIPVNYFGDSRLVWGVVTGYLVSLVNILFAFFSIKWAFGKPTKTFYSVLFGGMAGRIVILFLAIFTVLKLTNIPLVGFVLSLVGFYLTLQFFEIRYIQKELMSRKAA
ncbi:MAG: hypothetical protein ACE5HO_12845 [bacterium]